MWMIMQEVEARNINEQMLQSHSASSECFVKSNHMTKTLKALSLPWPWKVMRLFWLE